MITKTLYHIHFKMTCPRVAKPFEVDSPEFESLDEAVTWSIDDGHFYDCIDECLYQWFDFPTRDERKPEFRFDKEQYGERYQKLIEDCTISQSIEQREVTVFEAEELPNPSNNPKYL